MKRKFYEEEKNHLWSSVLRQTEKKIYIGIIHSKCDVQFQSLINERIQPFWFFKTKKR